MTMLCLLPVVFSSLLIAAHFYRMGLSVIALIAISMLLLLLFVRRRWAARLVQMYLLLAAAEWLRATLSFIEIYERAGMSWTRLAFILGGVTIFTLCSTLVFLYGPLKKYFRINIPG